MLNNRGDSGHPCFTPDLIGNASNLPPLQVMLVDGLRYVLFIIFRKGPSIPILSSVFKKNGCCILSKAFSASIEIIMWFFYSLLIDMVDYVDGFPNIELSLHSWYKSQLVLMNDHPDH